MANATAAKKALLVTLTSKADQARQLFSSVYWNSDWKGDFMLLTIEGEIPEDELDWFRKKGIIVKKCDSMFEDILRKYHIYFTKLYLFTEEFKRWDVILYMDSDIIVRAPLDELAKVRGFAAVEDRTRLENHFDPYVDKEIFSDLKSRYALDVPAFNAGMFCFSTDIIENGTFWEMAELTKRYCKVLVRHDQAILNLFFYGKWRALPQRYGLFYINLSTTLSGLESNASINLHFAGNKKPWGMRNSLHDEWMRNLEKAEQIDLGNRPDSTRKGARAAIDAAYAFVALGIIEIVYKSIMALPKVVRRPILGPIVYFQEKDGRV